MVSKRRCLLLSVVIFLAAAAIPALAQRASDEARPSPNASVSQTIGTTEVTIEYGRPGVKGRTVWGELVPHGQVWRTGANEATSISFGDDVTVEGEKLPAGTYALFTIPTENDWTIVFNKTAKQWGSFNYDAGQDALRIKVQPRAASHTEWMSFGFEDLSATAATVVLRWEKVKVAFKVEVGQ